MTSQAEDGSRPQFTMHHDPWPSLADMYPDACPCCAGMGRRIGWDSNGVQRDEICKCEKGQIVKEKGIIFDAESVRGILSGTKTQTRRVVKPQPPKETARIQGPEWYEPAVIDKYGEMVPGKPVYGIYDENGEWGIKCPYQPGDRLYVREGIAIDYEHGEGTRGEVPPLAYYRATDTETPWTPGYEPWKSPLHMPKWAARIWLEVTAVRVERLQSISGADAKAEVGIACNKPSNLSVYVTEFKHRWDAINAKRGFSWESNPYVFVYEFKVITQ